MWKLEKFSQRFLNMDILLKNQQKGLKCSLSLFHNHIVGIMSQIIYLGLSICFMKSKNLSLKNEQKLPVF